jgi:antitoxin VapB
MNIKNSETERLTRELADRTGESLTTALTVAVRERLERLDRGIRGGAGSVGERTEAILRVGREIASRLAEPWASGDIDELLYDETGLPT